MLQSSRDRAPLRYLEGVGQIIPGLEAELSQLAVGDQRQIEVKAAEVLAELGPDRAGLKDVARRAGVSHGLVTHYFGPFVV